MAPERGLTPVRAEAITLNNRFTDEYGLAYPIVQASLGAASMPALVAAVSEAGGMGTLGAVGWPLMSAIELRGLLRAIRALTARPFGVAFDTASATMDHIRSCIDARVAVVSFDSADPPPRFIRSLRGHGVRVWVKASTVAAARGAARAGVDAIIANGREAAGCGGETGTLTLVPAVVDAVWPVPVLASGGIADGRGLAAALALGADAAWIGTRFLASREANAHPEFKRRIIDAGEGDTAVSTTFSATSCAAPVRTLRTRAVREPGGNAGPLRAKDGRPPKGPDGRRLIGHTEIGGRAVDIPEYSCIVPTPETEGEIEAMCMPAGQAVMLIRSVRPAREIVRTLAAEADRALHREPTPA